MINNKLIIYLQDQAEQLKDEVIIEKSKSEKFQSDTKELTSQVSLIVKVNYPY